MRLQFPEGFLLGVSSASAQIEGGEVGSNWNDWYHQGRIKDDSDPRWPTTIGTAGARTAR